MFRHTRAKAVAPNISDGNADDGDAAADDDDDYGDDDDCDYDDADDEDDGDDDDDEPLSVKCCCRNAHMLKSALNYKKKSVD